MLSRRQVGSVSDAFGSPLQVITCSVNQRRTPWQSNCPAAIANRGQNVQRRGSLRILNVERWATTRDAEEQERLAREGKQSFAANRDVTRISWVWHWRLRTS